MSLEVAGTCRCYWEQTTWVRTRGQPMSTLDFFDYLAASDATHELAQRLIDIWVDRQLPALDF